MHRRSPRLLASEILKLDPAERPAALANVPEHLREWVGDTPPQTLTDIQRAARFYYLQKLAFGGKVDGCTFGTATTSPPRLNLLRIEEDLS